MSETLAGADVARASTASRSNGALARLWVGALLAPIGWVADFLGRYFVTRFVSVHDRKWPLVLCTTGGLVAVLVGAALCWVSLRAVPPEPDERSRAELAPSARAVAVAGLGLAAFFLLLVLAEALPLLVLGAREIT